MTNLELQNYNSSIDQDKKLNNNQNKMLITLIEKAYKDAKLDSNFIKPLGQIIGLIMIPTGKTAEILTNNINKWLDKVSKQKQSETTPPKESILVPALSKMRYTTEDILVDMYTELLTKASAKISKNNVLPNYVSIIERLSPDEAHLLNFMYKKNYKTEVKLRDVIDSQDTQNAYLSQSPNQYILLPVSGIPFLEIRNKSISHEKGWLDVKKYFVDVDLLPISKKDNIEAYLENLQSLGLISIKVNFWFLPISIYNHLEQHSFLLELKQKIKKNRQIKTIKGRIDLTAHGRSFLKIVVNNKNI